MVKERLILTNKQSLTTNKDTVIKSYADVTINAITTGYIISQHPSGGLIIGFYGGTRGFMFPKETERLGTNVKYVWHCFSDVLFHCVLLYQT